MHEVIEGLLAWIELHQEVYIAPCVLLSTDKRAEQAESSYTEGSDLTSVCCDESQDILFRLNRHGNTHFRRLWEADLPGFGPFRVEAAFFVQAAVGVRAEIVALGLGQVGR